VIAVRALLMSTVFAGAVVVIKPGRNVSAVVRQRLLLLGTFTEEDVLQHVSRSWHACSTGFRRHEQAVTMVKALHCGSFEDRAVRVTPERGPSVSL
jgi:hypothetical protein